VVTLAPADELARKLMHGWSRANGRKEFPWQHEDHVRRAANDLAEFEGWSWVIDLDPSTGWSVLLRFESGVFAVAQASESKVAIEYLGTLAGARYSETWHDNGELMLTLEHTRLQPITLTLRPSRLASHAEMRQHFIEATRPA
jgi:hypothetical protein